jgi:hypothetical protein
MKVTKDLSTREKDYEDNRRKSRKVSTNNSKGKSILTLAQDLVAKKYGIIQEDKVLDNMTLQ